jgi:HAD superfamily hydrolase (TIGR01484 family)
LIPKIIFSDFDGTLTLPNGNVGTELIDVIDQTLQKGLEFVIVSGRSLSWGHFFLTHFPINTAIMEGGGVIVYRDGKGHIKEEFLVDESEIDALHDVAMEISQSKLGKYLSADSYGRRTDQAAEIGQMTEVELDELMQILRDEKCHYSASNVHLNFWKGEVSKFKAVVHFLEQYRPGIVPNNCLYFGDALNDESMFQYFKNSVGVSNIEKYLDRMTYKPKTILKGAENYGVLGVKNFLQTLLQ